MLMQLAAIFAQADIAYVDGNYDYIPVAIARAPDGEMVCTLVPRMKGVPIHFNPQEVNLGAGGKLEGMVPDLYGIFHEIRFFKMEPLDVRHFP